MHNLPAIHLIQIIYHEIMGLQYFELWSTNIFFLTADADILESRVADGRYKADIILFILINI